MAKVKFLFILFVMAFLPLLCLDVYADPTDVELEVGYEDPFNNNDGHRSPILRPHIGIDAYTLFYYTSCDNCTLCLINEEDEVEYSTTIPSGTHTMVLPSYLSGEYRIEIIRGNFCFWGYIYL